MRVPEHYGTARGMMRVTLACKENYVIVNEMPRSDVMDRAVRAVRDHKFHQLRVDRVVRETAEAASYVLEIPDALQQAFTYEAGQFCNVQVTVEGRTHMRCYSMSSSPAVDASLQLTVKRVPGGIVSNWIVDHLAPGDEVSLTPPTGFFQLAPGDGEVLAFAAGSGITPVYSVLKTALATTDRRVRLLYANRDRDSVIFDAGLRALEARHRDRLLVVHHLDAEQGYVDEAAVRAFAGGAVAGGEVGTFGGTGGPGGTGGLASAECYICGPEPFMDVVEQALSGIGADPTRCHVERFTAAEVPVVPAPPAGATGATGAAAPGSAQVTIELGGHTDTTGHRPGTTVLQVARQMGMAPPYSCESGNCATCMAKVVEGSVSMRANNALTPEEVDDGWVLTCQAVPSSATLHVTYDEEG